MKSDRPALLDMTLPELQALLAAWGEKPFRARQLYEQLYTHLQTDPAAMTNFSVALRQRLAAETDIQTLELVEQHSGDGGKTRKALFTISNAIPVEAVLMIYADRSTVCVSTQSGCAMNCSFCATGKIGFRLNLTAGQMIEQVLWAAREVRELGAGSRALSNVVFMGMGEPFNNYDHWWAAVERLHDPQGFNMGARSFTVSTVGLVPGIRRLADEALPINLAISLHAADDELRNKLVPVNRKHPIAHLVEAVRDYTDKTHRRVSFEYVLLKDVNDSAAQAESLAKLCRGETDGKGPLLCHVNLIPWNPVPGASLSPSDRKRVLDFQRVLENRRVPCTVRVQRGVDIAAACGQLAGGSLKD